MAADKFAGPFTMIINHCTVNNHYPESYKRAETHICIKPKMCIVKTIIVLYVARQLCKTLLNMRYAIRLTFTPLRPILS